jgi:hypothetical protein
MTILQLLRYALLVLCLVSATIVIDEYPRLTSTGLAPYVLLLVGSGLGALVVHNELRRAREREKQDQEAIARRKLEADRTKSAERSSRLARAREKALEVAISELPDHFPEDLLFDDRGWSEEHVEDHLDPADIILKYEVPGEEVPSELRLYARDRVLQLEVSNYDVRQEIERHLEARRQDELEAHYDEQRRQDEARELAERERRRAQQRVIDISKKLHDG